MNAYRRNQGPPPREQHRMIQASRSRIIVIIIAAATVHMRPSARSEPNRLISEPPFPEFHEIRFFL
jgi:hypothetical protein